MQLTLKQQHDILNVLKDVATQHYSPEQGLELINKDLGSVVEEQLLDGKGFWKPGEIELKNVFRLPGIAPDIHLAYVTPQGEVLVEKDGKKVPLRMSTRLFDRMLRKYLLEPEFKNGFEVVITRSGEGPTAMYSFVPVHNSAKEQKTK
jgi:hypothetical protein